MSVKDGMRRFGVIGSPIQHSLSPLLHRTAYRELGIEDATYERFEVPAGELARFLTEGPGRELSGASITMPGKAEAFALATTHDDTAARLGIANTVLRGPNGGFRAENHDVHGISEALRAGGASRVSVGGVLGSGATALSAAAALLDLGAECLQLSARSPEKLTRVQALAQQAGAEVRLIPWERSSDVLASDAVVSALAQPGAEFLATTWSRSEDVPVPSIMLDVLYEPWPAPVAALLEERGSRVVSGLEMLLHQADMQLRSMLGVPAPLGPMRQVALAELARRSPCTAK